MAKRILQNEFEERIKQISPNAKFQILEYTTISKKCKIKCLKCGQVKEYSKASNILRKPFCCDEQNSFDLAKMKINQLKEFQFIKKIDSQNLLIKHNKCNNTFKRNIHLIIKNPEQCPYCSDNKGIALQKEQIQKRLDEVFFGTIKILEYNAIRTQNLYKCLKCGLIFKQTQKNLMASRGCPKCDRFKSMGQKKIAKLLQENNIFYKEQVNFLELSNGKQKFDFVVYKDIDCTQIDYFIECQGEQHFEEKDCFRDSLKIIQERDQRKRNFCIKNNYKLYELIYKNGCFLNLDILPFINNE